MLLKTKKQQTDQRKEAENAFERRESNSLDLKAALLCHFKGRGRGINGTRTKKKKYVLFNE